VAPLAAMLSVGCTEKSPPPQEAKPATAQVQQKLEDFQGKEIKGFFAPYLLTLPIDRARLEQELFSSAIRNADYSGFLRQCIGSNTHMEEVHHNWTGSYVRGPLVYQILKLSGTQYAVLWNDLPPRQINEMRDRPWGLSLVDNDMNVLSTRRFLTCVKTLGPWDMIYTSLDQDKNGEIVTKIRYVETGSGPGWDKEFTARTHTAEDLLEQPQVALSYDQEAESHKGL